MSDTLLRHVPLAQLITTKQVRDHFDDESLEGLAQTLRSVGQLQPIRARPVGDQFLIVDGERRFRAAKRAGLDALWVMIETQTLDDVEVVTQQLVVNCQREDLTPLEKARAIEQMLRATDATATAIAERLGLSSASVTRLLSLLTLPLALQTELQHGRLSLSAAYELARIADPRQQQELAAKYAAGQLTRDRLTSMSKSSRSAGSVETLARVNAKLSDDRSVTVVGPGLELDRYIETLEELLAKARKARTQGMGLATFTKMLRDQTQA